MSSHPRFLPFLLPPSISPLAVLPPSLFSFPPPSVHISVVCPYCVALLLSSFLPSFLVLFCLMFHSPQSYVGHIILRLSTKGIHLQVRLKCVPICCRLYDVIHTEKRLHLVFEYCDLDLKKHMDSNPGICRDERLVRVRPLSPHRLMCD